MTTPMTIARAAKKKCDGQPADQFGRLPSIHTRPTESGSVVWTDTPVDDGLAASMRMWVELGEAVPDGTARLSDVESYGWGADFAGDDGLAVAADTMMHSPILHAMTMTWAQYVELAGVLSISSIWPPSSPAHKSPSFHLAVVTGGSVLSTDSYRGTLLRTGSDKRRYAYLWGWGIRRFAAWVTALVPLKQRRGQVRIEATHESMRVAFGALGAHAVWDSNRLPVDKPVAEQMEGFAAKVRGEPVKWTFDAAEAAEVIAGVKGAYLAIFDGRRLTVHSGDADSPPDAEVPVRSVTAHPRTAYNAQYLLDALRLCSGPAKVRGAADETGRRKPALIDAPTPAGLSAEHVLMPVRIT